MVIAARVVAEGPRLKRPNPPPPPLTPEFRRHSSKARRLSLNALVGRVVVVPGFG